MMVNTFIFQNLRATFIALLLLFAISANAQKVKGDNKLYSNPYGISESVWIADLNKTNILLEKVDFHSFINFIVFNNDGNFNDINYFLNLRGNTTA